MRVALQRDDFSSSRQAVGFCLSMSFFAKPDSTFAGRALSLGELELDATIARVGFLGFVRIDGLEFAKAGGDEMLWRDALADQILHDRDCAPGGKLPVVLELRIV